MSLKSKNSKWLALKYVNEDCRKWQPCQKISSDFTACHFYSKKSMPFILEIFIEIFQSKKIQKPFAYLKKSSL